MNTCSTWSGSTEQTFFGYSNRTGAGCLTRGVIRGGFAALLRVYGKKGIWYNISRNLNGGTHEEKTQEQEDA